MNRFANERYKKILEQRQKNINRNMEQNRKFPMESSEGMEPIYKETTALSEMSPEARQEILRRQLKSTEGSANVGGLAALVALIGAEKASRIEDVGQDSDIVPEDEYLDPRFKKIKSLMGN